MSAYPHLQLFKNSLKPSSLATMNVIPPVMLIAPLPPTPGATTAGLTNPGGLGLTCTFTQLYMNPAADVHALTKPSWQPL